MPRKRIVSYQARHHDATITPTGHDTYPWTARRSDGDFCAGNAPTLTEAKQACAEWVGDTIEWTTA